jgi:acyl carrier protein
VFVQQQVAAVLGWTSPRPPDRRNGFFDLGMDSLMALDLKNRLQAAFGLPLRATVVFNYSTVDALADFLIRQIVPPSAGAQPAGPAAEVDAPADTLSEEELVRLFDEQIEAIDRGAVPRSDNG